MSAVPRNEPRAGSFDPLAAVGPARRQLGLRRAAGWVIRGLLAGGIVATLGLGVAHLSPFSAAVPFAAGALLAGALAGLAVGIRRWPDDLQAARAIDCRFSLHDRLTTALELRDSDLPLAMIQRADAGRQLDGLALRESARGQLSGRESGAAALVVILALALALVGLPVVHGHAQTSSTDLRRFHQAARAQLPIIVRTANQGLTPVTRRNVAIRTLNLALQHLRFQLQHATSRAAALRAISATQQQLRRVAASLHPIKPAAVSQLNTALASRMTAQQRSQAAGNSRQALKAAAGVLNRLASQIAHMTAAQRAALARSLDREANTASDSTLRHALRQAASSLGYNDPHSAATALQQAAAALDSSPSTQAAQSRVNAAGTALGAVKGDVTGLGNQPGAATSGGNSPGGNGRGAGFGQGKGTGSGQDQGKGAGSGQGSGKGQSQGNGRGTGGSGGTGGHGIGGGRGGSGNHGTGRSGARVYVPPTKLGRGAHSTQSGGPNGAPLPGSTVPYQQVIGRYQQTAHTALDRASLPPALQAYVRQYFSSISH